MLAKIQKIWKDPLCILKKIMAKSDFSWMPDKPYLKIMYYLHIGKPLNLNNPITYCEKLQWLKLYNRKDEYVKMVDKCLVKEYITEKIGSGYVVPTLGVWDRAEDIDFDALPERFVIKPTHDSGSIVICRDKSQLDIDTVRKQLNEGLQRQYFYWGREWPYKFVKPRLIAEEFIEDTPGEALRDYKYFCFDGVPKLMYISRDRAAEPTTDFFDMDFNLIDMRMRDKNSNVPVEKPKEFDAMRSIAERLSENIPHLRVDFYVVNGQIYVGELTFYHCSGFATIHPDHWNYTLGSWITLPQPTESNDE